METQLVKSGIYSRLFKFCPHTFRERKNIMIIYTVGTESIQTPLNFSLFVILQPFAKII